MPVLNGEDDFYLPGGGETEELPQTSYYPPWAPFYDPYWNWMRAAAAASAAASSTGIGPRTVRMPQAAPQPQPPPPAVIAGNAPLNAMLSPYAGPTRRRLHQQKMAAAKQLQKQQQQQQQRLHGHGDAQLPPKRQVYRGVSLQDLPSRTRSDSEHGMLCSANVTHF